MATTEFMALTHLLPGGRPAHLIVARDGDVAVPFATFAEHAARWYQAFRERPEQRFALYCEDSLTFAAALLGAWHAGKCVCLPGDRLPATLAALDTSFSDARAGDLPGGMQPDAIRCTPDWRPLNPLAEQLVILTSGSIGTPKAVTKTLLQLFSEVEHLEQCFGQRLHGATVQSTVSHQHIYGLLFRILWPLAAGRPFARHRLTFPESIIQAQHAHPTILVATPAHLKRLPAHLPWDDARPQVVFSSGGPLSEEALQACLTLLGQAPLEVFGSSETGGMAWRQRTPGNGTTWQALPGVSLRVVAGQLEVRSAHCPQDDWQDTNTLANLSAEGLVLGPRTDRIAKIEEKRISLTAIERVLVATGLISEAAVVMLDGPRVTLGVVAVPSLAGSTLLTRSGKRALNDALRTALCLHIDAVALPRRWRYLETLPMNAQGKTTQAALAACFDKTVPPAHMLSRTDSEAVLALDIAHDAPYFDGHFPNLPVLPGVTQIDWAIRFGRDLFPLPPHFLRLEQIKFQQIISPGMRITLILTHLPEKDALGFRLTSATGPHASGRAVFGPSP